MDTHVAMLEDNVVTAVETSNSVTALHEAMVELQQDLSRAIIEKNKEGFGYNYETLPQLLGVLRPLFVKTGLSVLQMPGETVWENGVTKTVVIVTRLVHKSGQYLQYETPVPVVHGKKMNIVQEWGATFTYAQRYLLKLLFNVAATNDTDGVVLDTVEDAPITLKTANRVTTLFGEVEWGNSDTTLKDLVEWVSGGKVAKMEALTEGQGLALVEALEKRLSE